MVGHIAAVPGRARPVRRRVRVEVPRFRQRRTQENSEPDGGRSPSGSAVRWEGVGSAGAAGQQAAAAQEALLDGREHQQFDQDADAEDEQDR